MLCLQQVRLWWVQLVQGRLCPGTTLFDSKEHGVTCIASLWPEQGSQLSGKLTLPLLHELETPKGGEIDGQSHFQWCPKFFLIWFQMIEKNGMIQVKKEA